MKTKWCIGILLLAGLATQAQTNNLTALLQQGLFEEQANRNLEAAIADYQNLAAQFDQDRQLAATAVFRLGECYRAEGRTNEAVAEYQRITREFSDQQTLVTLSRQDLAALGSAPPTPAPPTAAFLRNQARTENLPLADDDEEKEIQRIQTLIQNSPDLINAPSDGSTPLVKAASAGWLTVAAYLLDHGADVNVASPDEKVGSATPLVAAVIAGNKAMTEFLIGRGADVGFKGRNNDTPLHWAVRDKFQAVTQVLLASHSEVNARNTSGATPLFYAAQSGQLKLVQMLLAAGADVNLKDDRKRTVLNHAIGQSPDILEALLNAGANPNTEDSDPFPSIGGLGRAAEFMGRTPLSYAVQKSDPAAVKVLLAHHADPNGGGKNQPLLCAIQQNDTNLAALLLQGGANPNAVGNLDSSPFVGDTSFMNHRDHLSPLWLAVYGNDLPMVQLLLKYKAGPNDTQTDGQVPMFALFSGSKNPEIASALLNAGANPNAVSAPPTPKTLLQTAIQFNQPRIVELLLQHGADPNAQDASGNSSLHNAVYQLADEPVFTALLDQHANPNVRDNTGQTPLDVLKAELRDGNSRSYRFPDIAAKRAYLDRVIALLHEHGALDKLPDWGSITVSRPSSGFSFPLFNQDTNDWNHFTLLETIANFYFSSESYSVPQGNDTWAVYPLNSMLPFPDFTKVTIMRPSHDSTNETRWTVNLLSPTNELDVAQDVRLEFGDVVEIPERDHALGENSSGLTGPQRTTLANYVNGVAKLKAHGQEIELSFARLRVQAALGAVLGYRQARAFLLESSDLSRVKVTRRGANTGQKRELIFDCSQPEKVSPMPSIPGGIALNNPPGNGAAINDRNRQGQTDGANLPDPNRFWLKDGDEIEVPDKP